MSLLEPDKATTINRADWDHYMRPTPPLEGVFIPLDRSSSVDTVFYPYALLRLPRGTRCPSGSGEELKKETNYHLEMASQLSPTSTSVKSSWRRRLARFQHPPMGSNESLLCY